MSERKYRAQSNRFFDATTGENPEFLYYKVNNEQAFRAITEFVLADGNWDDPKFLPDVKEYFTEGLPSKEGENCANLTKKIQDFAAAWPEIKKDIAFKLTLRNMILTYYSGWLDTGTSLDASNKKYFTDSDIPVYFNMETFLNTILDGHGHYVGMDDADQDEYCRLIKNMRNDLEELSQQSKSINKKPPEIV